MLVRLAGTLLHSRTNIPLRRFAFAAHRCPPSKRDVGLAKTIGADMAFSPHRHPPAALPFAMRRCPASKAHRGNRSGVAPEQRFCQAPRSITGSSTIKYDHHKFLSSRLRKSSCSRSSSFSHSRCIPAKSGLG